MAFIEKKDQHKQLTHNHLETKLVEKEVKLVLRKMFAGALGYKEVSVFYLLFLLIIREQSGNTCRYRKKRRTGFLSCSGKGGRRNHLFAYEYKIKCD